MSRDRAFATVHEALQEALGRTLQPAPAAAVAGGSINQCVRWNGDGASLFVKLAPAERLAMFEAEAAGLRELASAAALRVPEVISAGTAGGQAWLALSWIEFGPNTRRSEARLGERLAMLHRVGAPRFGWHRDNTIGSTPQRNDWNADWVRFFVALRLDAQLALAEGNGVAPRLLDRGRELGEQAGALFSSYRPVPSLLHGDLWAGNWGTDDSGEPVIFDPAVYFGDRETDIAMTRLFGGFGPAFYAAYQSAWPLDQAAGTRRTLYNLYHVLNHFNLFGGGYAVQAESMIERLLAELGH
ncbi:MAG TPA: fructosamine kinase family protein [Steroidobacteraceae bacterium]